jgi:hypothetical protein
MVGFGTVGSRFGSAYSDLMGAIPDMKKHFVMIPLDVWRCIVLDIAAKDYTSLLMLERTSRTLYHHVQNGYVWYTTYRVLFRFLPMEYGDLDPREWRHYFVYLVQLRIRWHKRHVEDRPPQQEALHHDMFADIRKGVPPRPCFPIGGGVDAPIHYLVPSHEDHHQINMLFMDKQGTTIEKVHTYCFPDSSNSYAALGYDTASGSVIGVATAFDVLFSFGLWFLNLNSTTGESVYVPFKELEQRFGLGEYDLQYCKIFVHQGVFHVVSCRKNMKIVKFTMNAEPFGPTFLSLQSVPFDSFAIPIPIPGHSDLVFLPSQIWSLTQARIVGLMDRATLYETERQRSHLLAETKSHTWNTPIHVVGRLCEFKRLWTIRQPLNTTAITQGTSVGFACGDDCYSQDYAFMDGLLFSSHDEDGLQIMDLSGAGSVRWSSTAGMWKVQPLSHQTCDVDGKYDSMTGMRPHVLYPSSLHRVLHQHGWSNEKYLFLSSAFDLQRIQLDGR